LVGGNANNSVNDGFVYSNTNNDPANANTNIGFQISFSIFYYDSHRDHATWQKITITKRVLVSKEKTPDYESELKLNEESK
jgi:hypothetical protein